MSRHRPDLVLCMRVPGTSPGLVCEKCDGKCPLCDSHVHPTQAVQVCDECTSNRCVICSGPASQPAFYCKTCVAMERDRDGCPNVLNIGVSQVDRFYQKRKREQDNEREKKRGERFEG